MPPRNPNQSNRDRKFHDEYRSRRKKSQWKRYSIVISVILALGGLALYMYVQSPDQEAARKLLSRAESLVQEHKYKEARSLINRQLLKKHPETTAAANGETLQKNLKQLLKLEKRVQKTIQPTSSEDADSKGRQLKRAQDRLDELSRLEPPVKQLIQDAFGSLIEQPGSSPIVQKIKTNQKKLSDRISSLRQEIVLARKETIRSLIEDRKFDRARQQATAFHQEHPFDSNDLETDLKALTKNWIQKEFENTRDRIQELEEKGEYSEAISQVKQARDQFKQDSFQTTLNETLERLKKQRSTVTESEESQQQESTTTASTDEQEEQSEELPFHFRPFFTKDGNVVSGRVVGFGNERVKLKTEGRTRSYRLSDFVPFSAAQILHEVGRTEEAIRYSMDHGAYRWARRLLAGMQQQNQAWKNASGQVANAFLDGAMQMSPTQLRETAYDKQQWLNKQSKSQAQKTTDFDDPNVQSVSTIVYKGDVSRRLDIVFVNDGWRKDQQQNYNRLCNQLAKNLLNVKPFSNYQQYINFHRVNLISEQSEIDGTTVLETTPSLKPNYNKVLKYASLAPAVDLVVNVVHTPEGRANGTLGMQPGIMNINTNGRMGSTFIHELGHAFGQLDDEYVEDGKRSFSPDEEDDHINTTRVSDPWKVKWHYWRFPEQPPGQSVGTFEGAHYHEKGYYRPSPACRMRRSSSQFCVVCFEQMEKSFYHYVSPLGAVTPSGEEITIFLDEDRKIQARTLVTTAREKQFGVLKADWYLNGVPVENTESETIRTWVNTGDLSLSPGTHELGVRVDMLNERVRRDNGLLSDAHVWKLHVRPYPKPNLQVGTPRQTVPGTKLQLPVRIQKASQEHDLRIKSLQQPVGARFDGGQNVLSWTPTARQIGSHLFRVGVVNADQEIVLKRDIYLTVKKQEGSNNVPVMYVPPKISVREGESVQHQFKAWDPDRDLVTFQVKNAPKDLKIDPETGHIHWRVGYNHGFERKTMTVVLTDGVSKISKKVQLEVQDQPLSSYTDLKGYPAKYGLRKREPRTVLHIFENQLQERPLLFQYFESVRLLRHGESSVRSKAINHLQSILSNQNGNMKKRFLYILFTSIKPHMFHFTDSPEVLELLRSLVQQAKGVKKLNSAAKEIYDRLEMIRKYNKKRGVSFN